MSDSFEGAGRTGWLQQIRHRRVVPLTIAYFGLMWALLEFTGFLVQRYGLPDGWIDSMFLAMWLLLPAALLLIWRAGAPGAGHWRALDFVMLGMLVTIAGAALVWHRQQSPDAITPTAATPIAVPIPDVVAASRKQTALALFPVSIDSADPADAWLADGIPLLTEIDLQYDRRFSATSIVSSGRNGMQALVQRLGARDAASAPLAVRRRAVIVQGMQAFATGRLARNGQGLRLELELHRVTPDAALGPFVVEGKDVWALVDQIAARIRTELAPPDARVEANDPALRAVTSESLDALQAYSHGIEAAMMSLDLQAAEAAMVKAAEFDPTFTRAAYMQAWIQGRRGQLEQSKASLAKLMPRLDPLPPSLRYAIQAWYAQSTGDSQAMRRVYEVWADALPEDRQPRYALATLDMRDNPGDTGALDRLRDLALGSGSNGEILGVASMYLGREDHAKALELAEIARSRDATDPNAFSLLARIHTSAGRPKDALAALDQWSILRPDLIQPEADRALLQFNQGDWQAALATLDRAEKRAEPGAQRNVVLGLRVSLLDHLGRVQAATALLPELEAFAQQSLAPVERLQRFYLIQLPLQSRALGPKAARAWIEPTLSTLDAGVQRYYASNADFMIADTLDDGPALIAATRALKESTDSFSREYNDRGFRLFEARGRILSEGFDAHWPAYRQLMNESLVDSQQGSYVFSNIGDALKDAIEMALIAGDVAQAKTWFERAGRSEPGDPRMLVLQARILLAESKPEEAMPVLDRALAAWAEADPDFEPARQARELRL